MSDEPQKVDMPEVISHLLDRTQMLGDALEHHQFVLTAITATLKDMDKRLPADPEAPDNAEAGETRGNTTAFKLPDGYGTLLVTIKDDGMATIYYKRGTFRDSATMQFTKNH